MRKLIVIVASTFLASAPCAAEAQDSRNLEIDHLFVFVTPNAPEANLLRDAGFLFVPDTSIHRGQGTASLSCLFENAYLELIWKQGEDDPLQLADRASWRETGSAPIGIGLHRIDTLQAQLPFATWRYEASWMKPGTAIQVAAETRSERSDPLVFVVPPYMAFTTLVASAGDMLSPFQTHQVGVRRLTDVRVLGPRRGSPSSVTDALSTSGLVAFKSADEFALELTFDDGKAGKLIDFRPDLPLIIVH